MNLSWGRESAKHRVLAAEADGHMVEEATACLAPPMVEDGPPATQTEGSRPRQRQVDRLAVVLLRPEPFLTLPRAELHRAEGSLVLEFELLWPGLLPWLEEPRCICAIVSD